MDKFIDIVGSIVSIILIVLVQSAFAALPFWLAWNALAPDYFMTLPPAWHHLPFLDAWVMVIGVRTLTYNGSSSKS